jgi:deferrochelatase/peroxidase EfeB
VSWAVLSVTSGESLPIRDVAGFADGTKNQPSEKNQKIVALIEI